MKAFDRCVFSPRGRRVFGCAHCLPRRRGGSFVDNGCRLGGSEWGAGYPQTRPLRSQRCGFGGGRPDPSVVRMELLTWKMYSVRGVTKSHFHILRLPSGHYDAANGTIHPPAWGKAHPGTQNITACRVARSACCGGSHRCVRRTNEG